MAAKGSPTVRATRALDRLFGHPTRATIGWRKSQTNVVINVTGRDGYVYVTRSDQTVLIARNEANVPRTAFYPVRMVLRENTWVIISRDTSNEGALANLPDSDYGVIAHASTHQHGGSDEVATATPAANAIPKADGSGLLDDWVTPPPVDSVNGQTGAVVLDSDDITEGATNLYFSAAEETKLAGIEALADVTDTANVTAAGAVMDSELIDTSAGAGDAGKPIKLDAAGHVDATMINDADINLDNVTEGTTNKFFTATEQTKLAGIETAADVTDAGNIASSISGAATDDTIDDADLFGYVTGGNLVKTAWSNIKATLKTYLDTLYVALTGDQNVGGVKTFTSNLIASAGAAITGLTVTPVSSVSTIQTNDANARLRMVVARSDPSFIGWNVEDGSGNVQLSIAKNRSQYNVMSGFAVEGFISLGRSDGVDRAHRIKVFNDSTAGNNYILFSPHSGTVGSQVDVLRVTGNGRVGIGTGVTVAQGVLHIHNGTLGALVVSKTGITGTAQVIIPDGTGDVTAGVTFRYVLSSSAGGIVAGTSNLLQGGTMSVAIGDGISSSFTVTLNANGQLSVARTAGTATATIAFDMIWL